jgi:hypothetical protein
MSSKVLVAPANTANTARHRLRLLIQLAIGAPFTLLSIAAPADTGPACQKGGTTACQIVYTQGAAGHGDTGASGQPIVSTFTDPRTLTAIDGPSGWGAIQLESTAGDGGAADSDGQSGGHGGQASTVSATVGPNVSAQGANGGGVLRFTSVGGNGGGGQGDHSGSPGTSGTGGGAGEVDVTMNGAVTSSDAGSPGLFVLSQGGSSLQGDAGHDGFFGAQSGGGGGSAYVNVNIGGSIATVGTGASINAVGGAGGTGVNDSGGLSESEARAGGNGGSSTQAMTVNVSGTIASSSADGIDVQAVGGAGGNGGDAHDAPSSSIGGGGGNGGSSPDAALTVNGTGRVYGSQIGALVNSVGGNGGNGGTSGNADASGGGVGGDGGNAGGAQLTVQSGGTATGTGVAGLVAQSIGGNGGKGGSGEFSNNTDIGGNGGKGGQGGNASVDVGQTPSGTPAPASVSTSPGFAAIGVAAISRGGDGGSAAPASGGTYAEGGKGGAGNQAGNATVTIESNGSVTTQGPDTPATSTAVLPGVLVRSSGGAGGAGGNADAGIGSAGGSAGAGGTGSTATAIIDGAVSTTGSYAYGVLAQSLGGMGAAGGDASSVFGSYGGAARNGGSAGEVYVSGQGGSVTTTGTGAAAMVAQSIGGGGGAGGTAIALGGGGAIGGNGGAGGNGGNVTIGLLSSDADSATMSDTLITRGDSATALIGQSVGGAGGNGGNSLSVGVGLPSLAIGGDGKSGGIGGTVNVRNDGVITTFGPQSGGIEAQSVGGGGGNGGAGVAISAGVQISTSFALGGSGAAGGTGGTVNLDNENQVSTYGADAYGLKAQSVSGGGGQGGTALATAIALGGDPDLPTVAVSVSVGGSGGAGGDQSASPVTVTNNGLVTTAGDGAIGILAQNIAGGGGNGGDSTAASYANGGDGSTNVSVSTAVGGKGGGGGTGGSVTVDNHGLVATLGADAYGVFAQSIAGGGGVGGTGDSSGAAGSGDNSIGASVTVGGQGGQGGTAGSVTINTYAQGNVATQGDGANALFAQSVAGGGGASGGGTAKANGGNLSVGVTVGGNAGSGGQGGTVTVNNAAGLLTQGADADAIVAQSIGGGGGKAGKGASTSGGAQDPKQAAAQMGNTIASGLGQNAGGVTKLADGVYKIGDQVWKGIDSLADLQRVLNGGGGGASAGLRDDDGGEGTSGNLKLNATIGGQGGIGGAGGQVAVTNSGAIQTTGTKSDGIFAQSVGGGGGMGGASSFSGSETSGGDDKDSTSGSLKVGGSGAGAGAGSTVQVTNTGTIATGGVSTYGINAQSVGGGGGKGGATAASNGALKDFQLTLGGSGGAGGAGGNVTVTNDGGITTAEREGVAILAQSVGGGGGTAHLLSSNVQASDADSGMQIGVTIGGSGGAAGAGGNATVLIGQNSTGTLRTGGVGGIGVLAQSIGGGGGVITTTSAQSDAQGGGNGAGIQDGTKIPITIGDAAGASGVGGTVSVTLGAGGGVAPASSILTSKADAYGILAQSVGGGGGLYTGATPSTALSRLYGGTHQTGDGGSVSVLLNNGGWVYTSGAGAVGVIAQSVGGGGGLFGGMQNVTLASGLQANPTPQNAQGGNVSVDLENGGNIVTTGAGAHGILAQALGGGGGMVAGASGSGYAYAGANAYTGCSGSTCTGNVTVTMGNNTVVRTQGAGAFGIYAQSRGNGTNNATVNVGQNAFVESEGRSAGAIYVEAAGTNTVANAGSIAATATGLAIGSDMGTTTVNNQSTGVITGSIDLKLGSGTGTVNNDGKLNTGTTLAADLVRNNGTLEVGGAAAAGARTEIAGNLVQGGSGKTVIDSDHVAGISDRLTVDGNATLAGAVQMRPSTLSPTTVQVMDVKGQLDASQLKSVDPMLVHYQLSTGGTRAADGSPQQSVFVTPQARFDTAAAGLGKNAQSVADHLQANFDAGAGGLGVPLARIAAGVQDPATYKATLDSLGNEAQQAVGTSRLAASHAFVERMNSCPGFDRQQGTDMKERECAWGRVIDSRTTESGPDRANYGAATHSVQVGGQKQIADGWFLGGSAAYDNENFNSSTGAGNVSGNGGTVGVVIKHEVGNWTFSGAADMGYGRYDTQRNIAFPGYAAQASGSFNLTEFGLHSRIAYLVPHDNWYLKPYLDLHAVHMHTTSYSEQGAGPLGLNVNGNSDTMLSASPMLEVGARVELSNGMTLRPYAAVGATLHDRNEWGATAQFQGAAPGVAPFDTAASAPSTLGSVRLGVNLLVRKNLEVKAEYSGQFGSGYRSSEGILRVNYLF